MGYARMSALASVLMLAVVLGLTGCGAVGGATELRSVSDPDNLFHFKIPVDWQSSADQGFLSVYADNALPEKGDPAKALSVLVFTSAESSSAPAAEMLTYLVDSRARQREWKSVEKREQKDVKVGGVKGVSMDVSATGTDGREFDSRYIFVRNEGVEAFLVAVAPEGAEIADYDDELASIASQWFWHDTANIESTETVRNP